MFARCKNLLLVFLICLTGVFFLASWKSGQVEESWKWIQRCLLQSFNHTAGNGLKKWELSVTPDGFFRHKKYLPSGKQEYFSFHFTRLKSIDYQGTPDSGAIVFNTVEDDIIVQTYNDPKGNIDSMSKALVFPVLKVGIEQLDSLKSFLIPFRR